jgi:protein subunit release factor A
LIGIGIGIIISTGIMTGVKLEYQMSKSQIEEKARAMGMIYPDEAKVINDKGVSK